MKHVLHNYCINATNRGNSIKPHISIIYQKERIFFFLKAGVLLACFMLFGRLR